MSANQNESSDMFDSNESPPSSLQCSFDNNIPQQETVVNTTNYETEMVFQVNAVSSKDFLASRKLTYQQDIDKLKKLLENENKSEFGFETGLRPVFLKRNSNNHLNTCNKTRIVTELTPEKRSPNVYSKEKGDLYLKEKNQVTSVDSDIARYAYSGIEVSVPCEENNSLVGANSKVENALKRADSERYHCNDMREGRETVENIHTLTDVMLESTNLHKGKFRRTKSLSRVENVGISSEGKIRSNLITASTPLEEEMEPSELHKINLRRSKSFSQVENVSSRCDEDRNINISSSKDHNASLFLEINEELQTNNSDKISIHSGTNDMQHFTEMKKDESIVESIKSSHLILDSGGKENNNSIFEEGMESSGTQRRETRRAKLLNQRELQKNPDILNNESNLRNCSTEEEYMFSKLCLESPERKLVDVIPARRTSRTREFSQKRDLRSKSLSRSNTITNSAPIHGKDGSTEEEITPQLLGRNIKAREKHRTNGSRENSQNEFIIENTVMLGSETSSKSLEENIEYFTPEKKKIGRTCKSPLEINDTINSSENQGKVPRNIVNEYKSIEKAAAASKSSPEKIKLRRAKSLSQIEIVTSHLVEVHNEFKRKRNTSGLEENIGTVVMQNTIGKMKPSTKNSMIGSPNTYGYGKNFKKANQIEECAVIQTKVITSKASSPLATEKNTSEFTGDNDKLIITTEFETKNEVRRRKSLSRNNESLQISKNCTRKSTSKQTEDISKLLVDKHVESPTKSSNLSVNVKTINNSNIDEESTQGILFQQLLETLELKKKQTGHPMTPFQNQAKNSHKTRNKIYKKDNIMSLDQQKRQLGQATSLNRNENCTSSPNEHKKNDLGIKKHSKTAREKVNNTGSKFVPNNLDNGRVTENVRGSVKQVTTNSEIAPIIQDTDEVLIAGDNTTKSNTITDKEGERTNYSRKAKETASQRIKEDFETSMPQKRKSGSVKLDIDTEIIKNNSTSIAEGKLKMKILSTEKKKVGRPRLLGPSENISLTTGDCLQKSVQVASQHVQVIVEALISPEPGSGKALKKHINEAKREKYLLSPEMKKGGRSKIVRESDDLNQIMTESEFRKKNNSHKSKVPTSVLWKGDTDSSINNSRKAKEIALQLLEQDIKSSQRRSNFNKNNNYSNIVKEVTPCLLKEKIVPTVSTKKQPEREKSSNDSKIVKEDESKRMNHSSPAKKLHSKSLDVGNEFLHLVKRNGEKVMEDLIITEGEDKYENLIPKTESSMLIDNRSKNIIKKKIKLPSLNTKEKVTLKCFKMTTKVKQKVGRPKSSTLMKNNVKVANIYKKGKSSVLPEHNTSRDFSKKFVESIKLKRGNVSLSENFGKSDLSKHVNAETTESQKRKVGRPKSLGRNVNCNQSDAKYSNNTKTEATMRVAGVEKDGASQLTTYKMDSIQRLNGGLPLTQNGITNNSILIGDENMKEKNSYTDEKNTSKLLKKNLNREKQNVDKLNDSSQCDNEKGVNLRLSRKRSLDFIEEDPPTILKKRKIEELTSTPKKNSLGKLLGKKTKNSELPGTLSKVNPSTMQKVKKTICTHKKSLPELPKRKVGRPKLNKTIELIKNDDIDKELLNSPIMGKVCGKLESGTAIQLCNSHELRNDIVCDQTVSNSSQSSTINIFSNRFEVNKQNKIRKLQQSLENSKPIVLNNGAVIADKQSLETFQNDSPLHSPLNNQKPSSNNISIIAKRPRGRPRKNECMVPSKNYNTQPDTIKEHKLESTSLKGSSSTPDFFLKTRKKRAIIADKRRIIVGKSNQLFKLAKKNQVQVRKHVPDKSQPPANQEFTVSPDWVPSSSSLNYSTEISQITSRSFIEDTLLGKGSSEASEINEGNLETKRNRNSNVINGIGEDIGCSHKDSSIGKKRRLSKEEREYIEVMEYFSGRMIPGSNRFNRKRCSPGSSISTLPV